MELPLQLIDRLRTLPGFIPEAFVQAHAQPAPVSVRFNPNKPYPGNTLDVTAPVPWCRHGFYLGQRPVFTLDPGLHAGAYYVQEASSMFIDHALGKVLGESTGLKVLDLCAAPGGKTTLLSSLPNFDLVVANEIIRTRVNILYENAVKWGDPKIIVSNNDPVAFARLGPWFDVMLVDAPCSGSGLFRKDPDALKEWSLNNVQLCAERQKRILADALRALREGGILVYSTCSYSPEEDEEMMDWIMQHGDLRPLALDPDLAWGIAEVQGLAGGIGYRFFPHKAQGEGFFLACFSKGEVNISGNAYAKQHRPTSYDKILQGWADEKKGFGVREKGEELFLLPAGSEEDVAELEKKLNLRKSGVRAGTVIRGSLIPDHELVLSSFLDNNVPSINLDLDQALAYLRKREFVPEADGKGWYVMRYEGLALGLIKHLGNRVNNYYPASWRILMS